MIEYLLLTLLAVVAVQIVRLRDLFAAVMLSGVFSLLSASLFVVMDAVDVAFTEAAVGAGISTLLMLAALHLTTVTEKASQPTLQLLPLMIVIVTGAALIFGTLDMPAYGDPHAPIHHHVADYYLEHTDHEMHIPNVVTAVLAGYRGFDTLGETVVVFTATVGVLLLLGGRRTWRAPTKPEAGRD